MKHTLYLIDGHAQIYRAYYARIGNLTSPAGEPTRAVYVFCQMLLNLIRDKQPTHVAMVMDVSDETVFRKDIYPNYKAQREPPPEDLPPQMDRIVSVLEAARVPLLRLEGFEADDILATLAERLAGDDLDVYLVSKDKDLDQLITEHVRLYDPGKDEVIDAAGLLETKGWTPAQAVEVQTLTGDSVDNVPGVSGIGPKTAAKLIAKYGTAAAVLEHADELTPKQCENLKAFAPLLETTRKLVTLRRDVPIELDLGATDVRRFNWQAVRPIFEELGFRKLPALLPDQGEDARGRSSVSLDTANNQNELCETPEHMAGGTPAPPGKTGNLFGTPAGGTPAGATPALPGKTGSLFEPDGGQYILVNTPEAFEDFAAELEKQPAFALDTETTGVNAIDVDPVGLSFAWEVGRAYYLPVKAPQGRMLQFGSSAEPTLPLDAVRRRLGPILANERTLKVGQNLKYDLTILELAGMPVRGPLFDTMIAAFVLDPTRLTYKLDRLVQDQIGHTMIPITDLIGKGRDQLTMDQVPLDRICEYAAEDADYTWRLYRLYEPQLTGGRRERLFKEIEMPLVAVLTEMEINGVNLDVDFLQEMNKQMAGRIEELTRKAHEAAGISFNLDSPKQLGEVLFDKLGLRVVRKTKTGRSTDAESLEILANETRHPLPGVMLGYREIQKLRSTYVEALPAARAKRTGRIHTSYHQTGAITGRLSSSEPNLQNIPVRTELGRRIRRAFIPRSPDELLVVADYSQIELRVLAHFSRDEGLTQAFVEDRDIHAFVAAQINGVALEEVTKEMRGRAKAVNFGIVYGQTAFGLAQGTGMSRGEAQQFIDDYFRRYPRIRTFIDRCIRDAAKNGGVETISGRFRPIENITSRNQTARAQAERLAVNTVIQGSAADLIKLAMINLHRRIHGERLPLRMLLQVHDELVCEAPAAEAQRMSGVVAEVMSSAMELRVPLKVDVATGHNWLEAK